MKQELKTPDNRFELLKDRLKTRFFEFMLVSLLVGLFILPYGWVLIIGGIFIFIWGLLLTFM